MKEPPSLKVVKGDWVQSPEWLTFPNMIGAPSPEDPSRKVLYRIALHDVVKAAENRRRQPAYQLWSVLLGQKPPVPCQGDDPAGKLTDLMSAHACFKGLNRPNGDDDDSAECLAYVLKPSHFYEYDFRPPLVLSSLRQVEPDIVFVAYAKLDVPSEGSIRGVLTHWEFVYAAQDMPDLPENWSNRYQTRLW